MGATLTYLPPGAVALPLDDDQPLDRRLAEHRRRVGSQRFADIDQRPLHHMSQYAVLDLRRERDLDRFIRFVLARRRELAGLAHRQLPVMAGGQTAVGQGQGAYSNPASAAPTVVPFNQASHRGGEPGPSWTVTPGVGETTLGPIGFPANGYLRQLEIDIQTVTAAAGGTPVLAADMPAGIISDYRFADTNSNQIDDLPGFALLEDNVYGGYAGAPDPRVDVDYSASATSPSLQMMGVRELAPNGFGALANMSSSQQFKLTLKVASQGEIYTTAPTTNYPTFLISTWNHYWQLPSELDGYGRQQQQEPPFLGTTQYRWYSPANSVTQQFNLSIAQVGNEIRNLGLIARNNSSGARDNGVFPDPLQVRWNNDFLVVLGQRQIRKIMRELVNDMGLGGSVLDTGVVFLPFNFGSGRFVGGSGISSWLPTTTATRLQILGTQPTSDPGLVDVFVNDVSVGEVNPALRPVSPNAGSFIAPTAPQLVQTGA